MSVMAGFVGQVVAMAEDPAGLLRLLLPGASTAAQRLRQQVLQFCAGLHCKTLLLIGPVGIGKSNVGRIVALLRYLLPLRSEIREAFLKTFKFDGPMRISKQLLNWYEELNLTGLTESLAETQFFGIAPRVATDVGAPGLGLLCQR
jgi:hypothetical protein